MSSDVDEKASKNQLPAALAAAADDKLEPTASAAVKGNEVIVISDSYLDVAYKLKESDKHRWADESFDFSAPSTWFAMKSASTPEVVPLGSSWGQLSKSWSELAGKMNLAIAGDKIEAAAQLFVPGAQVSDTIKKGVEYLVGVFAIFGSEWHRKHRAENSAYGQGFREAGKRLMHALTFNTNHGDAIRVFGAIDDSFKNHISCLLAKSSESATFVQSVEQLIRAQAKMIQNSKQRSKTEAFWMPLRRHVILKNLPSQVREHTETRNGKRITTKESVPIQPIITKRLRAYLTSSEEQVVSKWNEGVAIATLDVPANSSNSLSVECETARLFISELSQQSSAVRKICRSRKSRVNSSLRESRATAGLRSEPTAAEYMKFAQEWMQSVTADQTVLSLVAPNTVELWLSCEVRARSGSKADLSHMQQHVIEGSDND